MATLKRVSQPLRDTIPQVLGPRYVCRNCRQHLQSNGLQIRPISNQTITRSTPRKPTNAAVFAGTRASYATRSRFDYISPEKSELDDTYKPAETWDGLEHVGYQGDSWKDLPAKPEDDEFTPFISSLPPPVAEHDEYLADLYLALVEVLAKRRLQETLVNPPTGEIDAGYFGLAAKQGISVSEDGRVKGLRDVRRLPKLGRKPDHSDTSTLDGGLEDAETQPRLQDGSTEDDKSSLGYGSDDTLQVNMLHVREALTKAKLNLQEPVVVSALKIFTQRIGQSIPDPVLNRAWRDQSSLAGFVDHLMQHIVRSKEQKRKVAETILSKHNEALQQQNQAATVDDGNVNTGKQRFQPLPPNVMVFSRRETTVDREMEVGRWKVIARELEARGLPVPGKKKSTDETLRHH